ncbi:MAG: phosphotransferase [Proteobacteria bacterium]|nr:phosphotransferase [Pseudomonadota bacterium]
MNALRIRTAFILGAGLGKRLRPLTLDCPKPLLPIGGRPLITYVMDHCLTVGVERFIVNTHHCAEAYDRAFPERSWRGWPILFRHEPVLLDTAGGLKNIEDLLDVRETLLVYNGDILSDLPLLGLLAAHKAGGREATLVLRSDGPLLNVALDADGAVCDLRDLLGNPGVRRCLFAGIYAVESRFLRRLTPGRIESVVPIFAEMLRERPGSVGSVLIDEGRWEDVGDPEAYARIAGAPPVKTGLQGVARRTFDASDDGDMGSRGEETAAFVRRALGLSANAPLTLVPVSRGGSDRDFFRVGVPGRGPAILMRYGRLREENQFYAAIAGFLREIGVAVPEICDHDPERGLILMEDLGDEDLFAFRSAAWEIRRSLYEKVLVLAAKIHAFPPGRLPAGLRLMPAFGPELYRWERDYFREQCVRKACGIELTDGEDEALEAEVAALAVRLHETPQSLIHRDFQSQNVMILKGEPVLIDFQGMRFGSPFYDLASLLYDPYVGLSEEERATLLEFYFDLSRSTYGWNEFKGLFLLASAQRLMQALGAYGFLGLERGKSHFLAHLPRGLDRLIDVTGWLESLPRLHALARRCRAAIEKQ